MAARPGRRVLEAIAGLGVGLVVVVAALVPAVTAGVGGTVLVRGQVQAGTDPVPFYPVGFWSPTQGAVTATSTDSAGRFSMELPDGVDGFAWAGSRPDEVGAVRTQDGRSLVRGVIGAEAPLATSHPLYQGWSAATVQQLGDGHDLQFHLQAAGRVAGTAPSAGGLRVPVELRRLDGSVVQRMSLDGAGRFTSAPVAPGAYAIVAAPSGTYLPAAARIAVPAGGTVDVKVPQPPLGATLSGRITSGGAPAPGVPVLVQQDGQVVARATTATTGGSVGAYSVGGLAAGEYQVSYGRTAVEGETDRIAQPVTIPQASPSPTPTASPAATAAPTTASGTRVVAVRRTADAVLPDDETVVIDDTLDTVLQNVDLDPAAVVTGHVSGADGAAATVVAEDMATDQVVRAAAVSDSGDYLLGGLTPGRAYRIAAATGATGAGAGTAGESTLTVTAGRSTVDVALAETAGVLSGTVSGATGGTVAVGDAAGLRRTAAIGADGAYRVAGLPPGTWPVVVTAKGGIPSTPRLVRVRGAVQQDLDRGPQPAVFKAWYIASGAGIVRISGTAVDDAGDQIAVGPETDAGHVTVQGLAPGDYRYVAGSFTGSVPALDGPWWYSAPLGGFTLRDGATNDTGSIALHVLSP